METNEAKEGRGIKAADLLGQVRAGVASIYTSGAWRESLLWNARFWNYSFNNQLLISFQKPDAQHVAGFHTWKALGRSVKKGEKGLAILRPMFSGGAGRTKEAVKDTATGKELGTVSKPDAGRGHVSGFAVSYVFDISQTQGKEAPESPCHKLRGAAPEGLRVALLALATAQGVAVRESQDLRESLGGYVHKGPDKPADCVAEIVLNGRNEEAQRVKTLIHELTHFLAGHLDERRKELTRDERELEAESGAFIVGAALGLDFSEYSFGYLATWAQGRDTDERDKALTKAGTVAAKVAKQILEALGQGEALNVEGAAL